MEISDPADAFLLVKVRLPSSALGEHRGQDWQRRASLKDFKLIQAGQQPVPALGCRTVFLGLPDGAQQAFSEEEFSGEGFTSELHFALASAAGAEPEYSLPTRVTLLWIVKADSIKAISNPESWQVQFNGDEPLPLTKEKQFAQRTTIPK